MPLIKEKYQVKFFLIVFGLMILAFTGLRIVEFIKERKAEEEQQNQSTTISSQGKYQIWLEVRTAMSNTALQIKSDGQLTYQENIVGVPAQEEQIKIERNKVAALFKQITQADFFNLAESYRAADPEIGSTISIITVKSGEQDHSVLCQADCPTGFAELSENIQSLWPKKFKIINQ